tara:strand:+ start:324 stop:773 length:450 start_codon:yes stop_codon:yes gene_type:complete
MKKHNRKSRHFNARKMAQSVKRHLGDTYKAVTVPYIVSLIDEIGFHKASERFAALGLADYLRRIVDIHSFTRAEIAREWRKSTQCMHLEKNRKRQEGLSNGAIRNEDNRLDKRIIANDERVQREANSLDNYSAVKTIGGCYAMIKNKNT